MPNKCRAELTPAPVWFHVQRVGRLCKPVVWDPAIDLQTSRTERVFCRDMCEWLGDMINTGHGLILTKPWQESKGKIMWHGHLGINQDQDLAQTSSPPQILGN